MRIDNGFSKKILINKVFLDQYYSGDIEIGSEEFRIAYSFLNSFNVNYEDDVLLSIETSGDALIATICEFIKYYEFKKNRSSY
jgi:hypothetical protein